MCKVGNYTLSASGFKLAAEFSFLSFVVFWQHRSTDTTRTSVDVGIISVIQYYNTIFQEEFFFRKLTVWSSAAKKSIYHQNLRNAKD